jgi:hypothetical protein
MLDKSRPMTLGDIFSNSFVLIKNTILRNVIIAGVFLIPAAIIMAYGFEAFFKIIGLASHSVNKGGTANINSKEMADIFLGLFAFIFTAVIFYLALMGAWIGILKTGCSELEGRKLSVGDAFREIFSVTYLRCLGLFLVSLMVLIAFYILIIIAGMIYGASGIFLIKFFAVLVIIALVLFMIYLMFLWYFAPVNIIYEFQGVLKAFSRSAFLVKGNWWKTFGTIFLISIVIGFASAIISTPITFLFEWDFISQFFKVITEQPDMASNPELMLKIMKSFGFTYGLIIAISSIIQSLVYPLFYVVLYFNLKITKNDFPVEINPDNEIVPEGPVI